MILFKRLFTACLLFCFMLTSLYSFAQTKAEKSRSKKLFNGAWVNKKAKRHLTISYDLDEYVLINDWQGVLNDDNHGVDAYKAFIEKDKLVMPEDRTDLRSPYCEIVKQGNNLLYRCRGFESKKKDFVDNMIFVREK